MSEYACCRHCLYRPKGTPTGVQQCYYYPAGGHEHPCMTCAVADER